MDFLILGADTYVTQIGSLLRGPGLPSVPICNLMTRQDWLRRGVLFQLDDYLTPKLSTGCSLTGVVLGKTLSVSKNRQFHVKHIALPGIISLYAKFSLEPNSLVRTNKS